MNTIQRLTAWIRILLHNEIKGGTVPGLKVACRKEELVRACSVALLFNAPSYMNCEVLLKSVVVSTPDFGQGGTTQCCQLPRRNKYKSAKPCDNFVRKGLTKCRQKFFVGDEHCLWFLTLDPSSAEYEYFNRAYNALESIPRCNTGVQGFTVVAGPPAGWASGCSPGCSSR